MDNNKGQKKGIFSTIGIIVMIIATTICIAVAINLLLEWYFYTPPAPVFAENDINNTNEITPTPFPTLEIPEITLTPSPTPTATPEPTYEIEPEPTATPEPIHETEPEPTATPEPMHEIEPEPTATPEPVYEIEIEPIYVHDEPEIIVDFSVFSFYIPENAGRYADFAISRPDLDAETIVWMVNVYLDYPFFERIQVNYAPNPIFISPAFRLPPEFSPPELMPVNNDDCILRATPETVMAFRAFRETASNAGYSLSATSAYRTVARQAELWERQGFRDGAVARPYHSEHQTGRAIDLWGPGGLLDAQGPSPTGLWVADNAHYYGFIIRYRAETTHITGYIFEPWHITYVGVEISTYMFNNNILSLEEFMGRTFVR